MPQSGRTVSRLSKASHPSRWMGVLSQVSRKTIARSRLVQESFDPYAVFLGFPQGQPPKNYYELLGLPLFESDPEKITRAVDALRGQVRHIRPGPYLAQWQQLLDELTAAKLCLLDPVAKSAYDTSVRQGVSNPFGGVSAGSVSPPGILEPAPATSETPLSTFPRGTSLGQPSGGMTPQEMGPLQGTRPHESLPPDGFPSAAGGQSGTSGLAAGTGLGVPMSGSPNLSPFSSPEFHQLPPPAPTVPPPAYFPTSTSSPSGSISPTQFPYPNYPDSFSLPNQPTFTHPEPPWAGPSSIPAGGEGIPGAYAVPGAIPSAQPVPLPTDLGGGAFPLSYGGQSNPEGVYPMPSGWGQIPQGGLSEGWPTGQVGAYPFEQGAASIPSGGIPQGYSPASEMMAPPLPGEKTHLAQKTASQSRYPPELLVGACVVLLLLAGGLLYLLHRIRSEGPEVVLGKPSSPSVSASGEKTSAQQNGSTRSGGGPGSGQPKEKISPQPPVLEKTDPPTSQEPGGSSKWPPSKSSGEKPSPSRGPSGKNGPSISEKPSARPEEKTSPPPKPSSDPAKQAAWQKAVEEARSALAQHDLPAAQQSLKIAEANAQTPPQHEEVERLQMLQHYLQEFWNGIRQSVSSLEAAQEFSVGKTRFAIVEGNSQFLVVRVEGRNIRWPIEKIPGSVVELLAKRWFRSQDPATHLALGAYHAVRGDTQRAKQYWEQASKTGSVDVGALLEELSHWPLPEQSASPSPSPLP